MISIKPLLLLLPIFVFSSVSPVSAIKMQYDEETICILEEQIPELAIAALKQAYLDALASGNSVLMIRDCFLVEVHPDGTEKIIKEIPPATPVVLGQIIKIQ